MNGDPDDEPETGRFWDEIVFSDEHGAKPFERAGDGEVCCRECGEAVQGGEASLGGHTGAAHGMSLEEYREKHPWAPTDAEPGPLANWAEA